LPEFPPTADKGVATRDKAPSFQRLIIMLELRPTCEHCDIDLPPDSLDARICSYECTFCSSCAEKTLSNVCPNCGGGFVPRPIRPARNWKGNNFLGADPASTTPKHRPVDLSAHAELVRQLHNLAPEKR
jgi:hypothetical protein